MSFKMLCFASGDGDNNALPSGGDAVSYRVGTAVAAPCTADLGLEHDSSVFVRHALHEPAAGIKHVYDLIKQCAPSGGGAQRDS